eukprot:CAMPEP_0178902062 /NCGR_PEP_ID=MMETSP0786-20121207/4393_1 /TAXON_ID=186022 /ORGANISM="Thalassionema frauenfeldii, Strain CCMP 1798" /LENGTH=45 /DNA_ID= /DNA_START= /DNA_END= /DNA_ORIENTATION=
MTLGDDFYNPAYSRLKVTTWLEFSFHEIVLYARQMSFAWDSDNER